MSTENNKQTPASAAEETASRYISRELAEARIAIQRVKVAGTIVCALLCAETIVVAAKFADSLAPQNAAEIASGIAKQQLDARSSDIEVSIKERIPELIQQSPDVALKQLPVYRASLEDKVTGDLTKYVHSTSSDLGTHLDTYFEDHQDEVKALLANANDPAALKEAGADLKVQLAAYLADKPADGSPSIKSQIDDSLSSIKDVKTKLDRLATAKDLSPAEQQTRRAIAIITQTVNKENIEPLPLKEAIPAPVQTASAE